MVELLDEEQVKGSDDRRLEILYQLSCAVNKIVEALQKGEGPLVLVQGDIEVNSGTGVYVGSRGEVAVNGTISSSSKVSCSDDEKRPKV